jgi:hypothetical protein
MDNGPGPFASFLASFGSGSSLIGNPLCWRFRAGAPNVPRSSNMTPTDGVRVGIYSSHRLGLDSLRSGTASPQRGDRDATIALIRDSHGPSIAPADRERLDRRRPIRQRGKFGGRLRDLGGKELPQPPEEALRPARLASALPCGAVRASWQVLLGRGRAAANLFLKHFRLNPSNAPLSRFRLYRISQEEIFSVSTSRAATCARHFFLFLRRLRHV